MCMGIVIILTKAFKITVKAGRSVDGERVKQIFVMHMINVMSIKGFGRVPQYLDDSRAMVMLHDV